MHVEVHRSLYKFTRQSVSDMSGYEENFLNSIFPFQEIIDRGRKLSENL